MKLNPLILAIGLSAGSLFAQETTVETKEPQVKLLSPSHANFDLDAVIVDFGSKSRPTTADETKKYELRENSGFVIESVEPDGTAGSLGLQAGDIVTQIDGRPVNNLAGQLEGYVSQVYFEGETLKADWLRGGEAQSGSVKLEKTTTMGEMMKDMIGGIDLSGATVMGAGGNLDLSGLLKDIDLEDLVGQIGSGSVPGVSVNSIIQLPDGARASLANGKLNISKDGEKIYSKEDFSFEDDLDEVPEQYRSYLSMLKGANLGNLGLGGGESEKVEETTDDLLDKVEDGE